MTKSSSWALLVDGTSLFFGQRAVSPEKNIDYFRLSGLLRTAACSLIPPKPALFFTAAQESNKKQMEFNDTLRDRVGWNVQTYSPHEATVVNPLLADQNSKLIRFDAMIGYALGRLAGQKTIDKIFVVSDSWPLARPIRDCVLRGTPVTVVFFGAVIDSRWHRLFREMEGKGLSFMDLDQFSECLFNIVPQKKEEEILPDI